MTTQAFDFQNIAPSDLKYIQVKVDNTTTANGRRFVVADLGAGTEGTAVFHDVYSKARKLTKKALKEGNIDDLNHLQAFVKRIKTTEKAGIELYNSKGCWYQFATAFHRFFGKTPIFGTHMNRLNHLEAKIQHKLDDVPPLVTHVEPLLPVDVPSYAALREMMEIESTLYVADETGRHKEPLLGFLGKGGSKKAIQVSSGRALMLPNMDSKSPEYTSRNWERMVLEEVKMSKILTSLGLLSPLSEYVNITLSESSEHLIPAYTSETFQNFSSKDCFIIDTKNKHSSTWKESLFQSDIDRLNEENWDSVVDSILTDVAQICLYDIPVGTDSLNFAVVKKPSDSALSQYEVRYFGFDFSSRHEFLAIPDIENGPSTSPDIDKVTRVLDKLLDNILFCEFGMRYDARAHDIRKII